MTEISEANESFSVSFLSNNNEEDTNFNTDVEKINNKNYPIRCSNCSNIAILNADFKKNYFCTICDNKHKNEYNSFNSFINEACKNLDNILCNECKKLNDGSLFRCNICNLFICNECKSAHNEKYDHKDFIEMNKIDICCPIHGEKFKYFNTENKNHLCENCYHNINDKKNIVEIKQFYISDEKIKEAQNKIKENILICKNVQKLFNEWINELTEKVQNYVDTLKNYCLIQEILSNFIKNEDNNPNNIYYNNFNVIINYESFNKNQKMIDNYIQQINNKINNFYNKKSSFETKSDNFIELLNDFNDINFIINSEKIKEENIQKNIVKPKKKKNLPSIESMKKLKLDLKDVKSFSALNNEKNIAIGLKTGEIQIYEFIQEDNFKLKLKIKNEYEKEIKFICELDTDLIAVSDGKTSIKIIEFKNDMEQYSIVQTLDLKDDSGIIYSMIKLPILSYNKNRHYFCVGDENHILIWKSNKQPKNKQIFEIPYDDENDDDISIEHSFYENEKEEDTEDDIPLFFTLVKDIKLNTLSHCLIEVNDQYIAAACTKTNTIKFFNIKKNFEEKTEIKNITVSAGSNILSILPKKNILIVGCVDGFCLISTTKLQIVKILHCKYGVTSLETISKNSIISCCSDKKENKIKLYKIDDISFSFKKSSEKNVHNTEVWNLKTINNRLFFTNNNNINYLR